MTDQTHNRPRRVLIAEDGVDEADTLRTLLGIWGFDVRVAPDGPTALRLAESFGPDIALLGLGLPGVDGYEVARRLRDAADTAGLRLVAVAGHERDATSYVARTAGFDHFLRLPFDPEELRHVVTAN